MEGNVRSFNTGTADLREEILKQQPHIVVLQETLMWIFNDRDLNWAGDTILTMEPIQQTKGKRGGLAVISSPEVEFTELFRTSIGVDFEALKGPPIHPENAEFPTLSNTETIIPDGEIDISQQLMIETAETIDLLDEILTQTQT